MSDTVVNMGCRLNIHEGEVVRAHLAAAGGNRERVVVNSCAVTSEAVRATRQAIRRARRARPEARLLVTGCAADIERDALSAMPEIDGIVPNVDKLDARRYNVPAAMVSERQALGHTRAFLAVQNGCDHACTFCVIPLGRGRSRSLTIEHVVRKAQELVAQGVAELVLTGVDLTSWGHDLPGAPSLGMLVDAVLEAVPDLPRLRLSSVDGVEIDEHLLAFLIEEPRLMPHIHLSLQHGHDLILKRMKRRHSRADAIELVARLKAGRPDIAIGADLIAGFPTESEEHHRANLSIVRELEIVHGHVFPYSPRPQTPAARMPQVDRAIVKARAAELRAAIANARNTWMGEQIGVPQRVLAERDGGGYAENFARVALPHGTVPGTIVTITPTSHAKGMLQ